MFSGKSSELMRRIRRFAIAQNKCMVVKYSNDKRYSVERLATHDQYARVFFFFFLFWRG